MKRAPFSFSLTVGGREYLCRAEPSARKSIRVRMLSDGSISIQCPLRTTRRELERLLSSRAVWLEQQALSLADREPVFTDAELAQLKKQTKADLAGRVERFATQMGVKYGRVSVRAQKSRWGSCSAAGNLNFNCLLMLCPESVRDYVVVHELSHLREMNHSPRFWQLVESHCPDYRDSRKWLKENGAKLIARLPMK